MCFYVDTSTYAQAQAQQGNCDYSNEYVTAKYILYIYALQFFPWIFLKACQQLITNLPRSIFEIFPIVILPKWQTDWNRKAFLELQSKEQSLYTEQKDQPHVCQSDNLLQSIFSDRVPEAV